MDPKQYGAGRGLISPRMGDQWRAAFNTIEPLLSGGKKKKGREGGREFLGTLSCQEGLCSTYTLGSAP